MTAARLALVAWLGLLGGWVLGTEYPPCCPGAARGCNVASGSLGVQYCRRHGFGWERCQSLSGPDYPQALWRGD